MAAQIKRGFKLTQEHYAYIYGVSPRTIVRWQKRELPLDDPRELIVILADNPRFPAVWEKKDYEAILADYKLLAGG
jgi:DNA-binding transcriptional regulator YiaG